MKIPFDIKYRPQIESGEYKVETIDGKTVRIVCWDKKADNGDCIVALVNVNGDKERTLHFDCSGRCAFSILGQQELFIITPEPELSEFEEAVGSEIFDPPFNEEQIKVIKEESAKLLELAKEELQEKVIHDYWKQAADRCVQAREEGKAEALKEIEQDPESSYAFKRGVEYGKEEALKNLPRWESFRRNSQDYPFFSNCEDGENCLVFDGKCIKMCELLKLPGFNE